MLFLNKEYYNGMKKTFKWKRKFGKKTIHPITMQSKVKI